MNTTCHKSLRWYTLRWLLGFAALFDGLIRVVTLGVGNTSMQLATARAMAREQIRMNPVKRQLPR